VRQIILDMGSGNSCKNDITTIRKMINSLKNIDECKITDEIIIKWQLFEKAGDNIPLKPILFSYAHEYAQFYGFKTTASVFDRDSLNYLLEHDIPFVKIANNKQSYEMARLVPHNIKKYVSWGAGAGHIKMIPGDELLYCVSEYPAKMYQYEALNFLPGENISDHTANFDLYKKYQPKIVEWHYKLPESTGPDAGDFARTWKDLKLLEEE